MSSQRLTALVIIFLCFYFVYKLPDIFMWMLG